MKNSQYAISFALMGIGGVMIKESKMNLKTASKNKAMASAVTAQIDSICIALEGITQHTMIITELLEKLGMLYMKSIKNISIILKNNGLDSENYSEDDINALNVSLSLTKLIYRIINTPLLDENGNIENSVNYPSCSLGYRKKASRICVCHYNRPNVISQLTSLFGEAGVNISDMVSKSRGEYAYAMFDVEAPVSDEFEKKLEAMENIIRIRIL